MVSKSLVFNVISAVTRGDHFRFGSVFIKKNNQIEILKKKKLKPVQTDQFRFNSVPFFRTKTSSNQFGLVFLVWLGFFRFGSGFFWFFRFHAYKTETEPVGFLKILIGFFWGLVFSVIFYPVFSVFLLTP
jgi:hypothetical protein